MKQQRKITAWSYSRLSNYESCPLHFYLVEIEKRFEPKPEAMARGIKIHNEAAAYLAGETDEMPGSCAKFAKEFMELRTFNPIVEQKWAFDRNWKPTKYMGKDVYCRVSLDVCLTYSDSTAEMIDHKTGKYYEGSYDTQEGLFAAAIFKKFRETEHVTTRLWYLDHGVRGKEVIGEWSYDKAMDALADLEDRAQRMMTATRYPAKPSWKCGSCHFRRDNGGPCQYG